MLRADEWPRIPSMVFEVDRGFQVYLDSYAEGQRFLDYASLAFGAFEPGALVAHRGSVVSGK